MPRTPFQWFALVLFAVAYTALIVGLGYLAMRGLLILHRWWS